MKTSHSHKQYLIEYLIAVALAALLATAHAQQVPLPTTAAEVPGPAMTKEYVQMIGRMAYLWEWPLVNSHNRRTAFAT